MKILCAKFVLEANAYVPMKCDLKDVALSFGAEAASHMQLPAIFEREDIELIPVICADAACSGVMKKTAFDYIEQTILNAIKENLKDLDGIFLHLHGASEVEEIGSGEHHLLREVRKIVGPYMPVVISCDPHGNLDQEYVENATYIRSFRESPHIDIPQTVENVCTFLVNQIENPKRVVPVYRKLPLILGGEQSVSADEPVRSINAYMDELEKDPRIASCSWHVGYLRHDTPVAGCGIVVIPADEPYREYANSVADQLAQYIFDKRHEFHYTGTTMEPDEAIAAAVAHEGKPVFITDSGDNVTSGAMGANTTLLQSFLELENLDKKVLFAAIQDKDAYQKLSKLPDGAKTEITLGMDFDEFTKPVTVSVTVVSHSVQEGTRMYGEHGEYGGLVGVQIDGTPITVIVTENNHSFVEIHQLEACKVGWEDFDIIVVKQGYIHPELKEAGSMNIMALTGGSTLQDTRKLPFKLIMRPMYPIDNI